MGGDPAKWWFSHKQLPERVPQNTRPFLSPHVAPGAALAASVFFRARNLRLDELNNQADAFMSHFSARGEEFLLLFNTPDLQASS